jgi:hypothetical protein
VSDPKAYREWLLLGLLVAALVAVVWGGAKLVAWVKGLAGKLAPAAAEVAGKAKNTAAILSAEPGTSEAEAAVTAALGGDAPDRATAGQRVYRPELDPRDWWDKLTGKLAPASAFVLTDPAQDVVASYMGSTFGGLN